MNEFPEKTAIRLFAARIPRITVVCSAAHEIETPAHHDVLALLGRVSRPSSSPVCPAGLCECEIGVLLEIDSEVSGAYLHMLGHPRNRTKQ
jgi:hypothetical protein